VAGWVVVTSAMRVSSDAMHGSLPIQASDPPL
jgi:hypothetical protein